jgi:hypothetical protein
MGRLGSWLQLKTPGQGSVGEVCPAYSGCFVAGGKYHHRCAFFDRVHAAGGASGKGEGEKAGVVPFVLLPRPPVKLGVFKRNSVGARRARELCQERKDSWEKVWQPFFPGPP